MSLEGNAKATHELRGKLGGVLSNVIDNTLSIEGASADAKATGDAIKGHSEDKNNPHGVTASQVGARPSDWMPSASDVGAVPESRKVNGKALSSDITLTASDVGARPSDWMPTSSDVGAQPALGFIPVQQGLDDGKGNNKIRLAWDIYDEDKGALHAFVDGTHIGRIVGDNPSFGGVAPITNGGTGATDAETARENLGVAPAGYGLGSGGVNPSSLGLTGCAVARGGFFRWDTKPDDAPFGNCAMIVAPRSKDSAAFQLAYCTSGTNRDTIITRLYSTSSVNDWKYLNPRMAVGTEYLTTEQYDGKKVYRKLFTYSKNGTIGSASGYSDFVIGHGASALASCVAIDVAIVESGVRYRLPYVSSSGGITAVTKCDNDGIVIRTWNIAWNTPSFEINLAFTKD